MCVFIYLGQWYGERASPPLHRQNGTTKQLGRAHYSVFQYVGRGGPDPHSCSQVNPPSLVPENAEFFYFPLVIKFATFEFIP